MKYRNLKHWKYELMENMRAHIRIEPPSVENEYILVNAGVLTVRARYAWDGASFIARDTPTNMRASLFHDALCQLIGEGLLDKKYRKYADELLRVHMLEDQLKDADGLLVIYGPGGRVLYQSKKKKGLKRAMYLRWGRFRANGYYTVVRAHSKLKGNVKS